MGDKKKILVIDDDRECVEFEATILEREGFDVIKANDGKEGLTKAVAERPDLIVLDVMMPGQNGWDTCDKLRASEIRNVPIIYLTCVDTPKSLYTPHGVFETEWDEYLTKPVNRKKLLATVKKLLQPSPATQ